MKKLPSDLVPHFPCASAWLKVLGCPEPRWLRAHHIYGNHSRSPLHQRSTRPHPSPRAKGCCCLPHCTATWSTSKVLEEYDDKLNLINDTLRNASACTSTPSTTRKSNLVAINYAIYALYCMPQFCLNHLSVGYHSALFFKCCFFVYLRIHPNVENEANRELQSFGLCNQSFLRFLQSRLAVSTTKVSFSCREKKPVSLFLFIWGISPNEENTANKEAGLFGLPSSLASLLAPSMHLHLEGCSNEELEWNEWNEMGHLKCPSDNFFFW